MNKTENPNLKNILDLGKQRLNSISETASLDAEVLLAKVIGKNRAYLLAHPEEKLNEVQIKSFKNKITRLVNGEALPYVLGEWEFYGMPFIVTPDVLIPRPETEMLVEKAIEWLLVRGGKLKMVDVGTGSGIIPICIASKTEVIAITAIDISKTAIEIARNNAHRHSLLEQIEFIENDLLLNIDQKFDLITANLPYIPTETLKDLAVFKTEPSLALDGGEDGLNLIRRLLEQAPSRLNIGGLIMLEIEYRQGDAVMVIASKVFPTAKISVHKDLAGHDRLVLIQT